MDANEVMQPAAVFVKDLRTGTQEWHQKLEDLELSRSILRDDIRMEDYTRYLSAMYGYVQPFEAQAFEQLRAQLPDIAERRKAHLLEADLRILGLSEAQIETLPKAAIELDTQAQRMGAMYVMEGSTLGGMVIAKHIHKTLGLDPQNGASFFQPYGQTLSARWKSFLAAFTDYTLSEQAEQEVITAATDTFKGIYHWFRAWE